jgi:hypothetical protein
VETQKAIVAAISWLYSTVIDLADCEVDRRPCS